ncbi:MAG: nuclear transport factor 2 family protein [Oscillospiraceae bacterium]
MTLEQRVQRLEDIEAIKYLQGTYFRCLDSKLHEEIGECFAPDVTTAYSNGKLVFHSREEVVNFFTNGMPIQHLTMHQGHTPEITMTSETTATSHWYLHDALVLMDYDMGITGGAIYKIDYKKIDGKWLISWIGYNRTYEERWFRKTPWNRNVTENMFDPKLTPNKAF